tara:strand:+ start:2081 stop:2410 length:330 start_codon:yes stop_codon:yes gene_type:complete
MKHYYDPGLDDCPIHDDSDTEQLYTMEITFPIGYAFDFAGWRSADEASKKLVVLIEKFMRDNSLQEDNIIIEAQIKHVGKEDNKMCGKVIRKYPDEEGYMKIIKKWLGK